MNDHSSARYIVTGHRRGLGAALTHALLAQGHAVLGMSRGLLYSQANMRPSTLHEVAIDLAQSAQVCEWIERDALTHFLSDGRPAVLINNAGVVGPVGQTGQLSTAEIFNSITANTGSVIALTNAFVSATCQSTDRRVVHISSGAGRSPYSGWTVYCASKAALDHHARSVAAERHAGLRIESIAPGIIDTDMQAEVRGTSLDQFPMREKFDRLQSERLLTPPDIAAGQLLAHVQSDQFGANICTDLRSL